MKVFLAIFVFGFSSSVYAEIIGKVVSVADSDTITVLDEQRQQHKIRLAGIDAPEKKQAFGNVAKQHMADMVFGKEVRVDTRKQDRYGRTIGRVWVASAECRLPQEPRRRHGVAYTGLGVALQAVCEGATAGRARTVFAC